MTGRRRVYEIADKGKNELNKAKLFYGEILKNFRLRWLRRLDLRLQSSNVKIQMTNQCPNPNDKILH